MNKAYYDNAIQCLVDEVGPDFNSGELYVASSGPESDQDEHGDEYPVWFVAVMYQGDEICEGEEFTSYDDMDNRAQMLSRELGLDYYCDASDIH